MINQSKPDIKNKENLTSIDNCEEHKKMPTDCQTIECTSTKSTKIKFSSSSLENVCFCCHKSVSEESDNHLFSKADNDSLESSNKLITFLNYHAPRN